MLELSKLKMMKKNYIRPELEIFCFEAESVIAASINTENKGFMEVTDDYENEAGTNKFQHNWNASPWE